jgi:hypothetical protein
MTNRSSRLAGVNEVLSALGYETTRELRKSRESIVAEDQIQTALADLQTKGWWFNRVRYTPTLTPLGWAHIPDRFSLDEGENSSKWVVKEGRRVYDRSLRTYVHGADGNLLVDEDDLSTGNWTATNATVAAAPTAAVPGNVPQDAQEVDSSAGGGRITQDVSGLVDGVTYTVGVYSGVSVSQDVSTTNTQQITAYGQSSAREMRVDFDFSVGGPFEGAQCRSYGETLGHECIPVVDRDLIGAPEMFLVTFDFTYEAADGDIQFRLYPGGTGSALFWRPFITVPHDFPSELKLVETLPYEALPVVVQRYVVRRATYEAANILSASQAIRQHAAMREAEAFANLQRTESRENEGSMLDRSPSVARIVGRVGRRPALESLYGRPKPGTDI